MTVRLKKEARELLPAFVITLLLVGAPFPVWGRQAEGFPFLALALGSAIMGGISFGAEIQRRTFPLLLSQPIPRAALWKEKMLVLAGALILSGLALKLCAGRVAGGELAALLLIPLCAFAGAPWLTLLVGNGIAGSVFAMALPGLLIGCAAAIGSRLGLAENHLTKLTITMLLIYCIAACFLGYRRFGTMQALEGGGRQLRLPAGLEAFLERIGGRLPSPPSIPLFVLLKKELCLQQISLLPAVVFVVVAGVGALVHWTRPAGSAWAEWIIGADLFLYVFILPLLVGAVAFAEERDWGLMEWHLTLPPSARQQWAAKVLTTLPISLVFGLLLPGLLVFLGHHLFAMPASGALLPASHEMVTLFLAQLLATSLAAYGGSFSASTLKAMLLTVGIVLALGIIVQFARYQVSSQQFRVADEAPWYFSSVCLALLLGLVQWLGYRNFRRSGVTFLTVVAQIACLLATAALMSAAFAALFLP